LHDRIELLGHDGFTRIHQQARDGEVEQHGEIHSHRRRRDRVTEPDVDLQPNASRRDASDHLDPHPAVFLILADRPDGEGARVEFHTVVGDLESDHFAEDVADPAFARIANAEQIDVARGAMRMAGPQREQRRAFEDEAALVSRLRQPVEQALVRIPGEQELEIVALLAGEVKQPSPNRRANVFRRLRHASASR
jgi:hypothetical protein